MTARHGQTQERYAEIMNPKLMRIMNPGFLIQITNLMFIILDGAVG